MLLYYFPIISLKFLVINIDDIRKNLNTSNLNQIKSWLKLYIYELPEKN